MTIGNPCKYLISFGGRTSAARVTCGAVSFSSTAQMEKMLKVFSPLYEKQMLTSSGNLSGSCKPGSA
jgi:hypothetical protein